MSDPKLKLFVVGESSGNPDDWSEHGGYSIVLAADSSEAESVSAFPGPAIEVRAKEAVQLAFIRVRDL
jgi:hypothetical protein